MNIFALDFCPRKSAEMLCDKHVVKMALESAQMACTVLHRLGFNADDIPYRATHRNHPCVVWASASRDNFQWLIEHGLAICYEYTRRYRKQHKCERVLLDCADLYFVTFERVESEYLYPDPFVLAMPDEYKNPDDRVASYRAYYQAEKAGFAKYTNREKPNWLKL